ncbi:MAG: OmpA family protein [Gammaproteobacteria bacterium]|nr:OmpA family protein [Gammaproteobacteria bacterium]
MNRRHAITRFLISGFIGCWCVAFSVGAQTESANEVITEPNQVDHAAYSERLSATGITPLVGSNIAYTLDQVEVKLRRLVKDLAPEMTREDDNLLVRVSLEDAFTEEQLNPDFRSLLNAVAIVLQEHPAVFLQISAHADRMGSDRANRRRTEQHADAAAQYLGGRGIPLSHIMPVAYGESRPLIDKNTPAARKRNRRIELLFLPVTAR